jgi:alanyl-tRNA synthetase
MQSKEVRQKFLDFFESKGHKIVNSAPIVVKNDPTLMFTNAGMNQFKDYFLGTKAPENRRVADAQKCLRVSGKHNDLEEVGVDTYHHTMFEMLGNWSFGDYFKKESIIWAWELLTTVYKLDPDRLWVTVFGGDESEQLPADEEAYELWKSIIPQERILRFGKKDNFWEMGDSGPCGPCSEIHIDLRKDEERKDQSAADLVNRDHEQVIELWNLVFIQHNRKQDGSLESLPEKHVDTGMGFERLVRAIQLSSSNYDSDLFQLNIEKLAELSGVKYGLVPKKDIAFRVVADHVRALAFAIADGQLPSNIGAGYVLRRILRRAVRYGYTYLGFDEAFMYKLLPNLDMLFGDVYPELRSQLSFVQNVIKEEEQSFLRTLSRGVELLQNYFKESETNKIPGKLAFELYDTYGFPVDLTRLIASENGREVDMEAFQTELEQQKARSRKDAHKQSGDWVVLAEDRIQEFVGYDRLEAEVRVVRYRIVEEKGKKKYQLVFNLSPFYPEGGGQVGDQGLLEGSTNGEKIAIYDTVRENDLIIHLANKLPENLQQTFMAQVDNSLRQLTTGNHSATHLLHAALRNVLGKHVAQKGSLVHPDYLRFDFSHFAKMTDEELELVEKEVNAHIRKAIPLQEERNLPYKEALDRGAMALFGEKYGDTVRVITFDSAYSVELCGGTHVSNTAQIGMFKIISESSVASGVRRIEAITSEKADHWVKERLQEWAAAKELLSAKQGLLTAIDQLQLENAELRSAMEAVQKEKTEIEKKRLLSLLKKTEAANLLVAETNFPNQNMIKDAVYDLRKTCSPLIAVLAQNFDHKPHVTVLVEDELQTRYDLNAGKWIRELAKHIQGGGGGQPFYATAGGKNPDGIASLLQEARERLEVKQ